MTNKELIQEARRILQETEPEKDLDTYKGWQERGFQVQKGEKSIMSLEGRGTAKDYSKSKRGRRYFYDKKIYLFGSWQVRTISGEAYTPKDGDDIDDEILNAFC